MGAHANERRDQGYRNRTRHKLKIYEQNQIEVIPLYPNDMTGCWQDRFLKRIDDRLENRLNDYRGRTAEAGVASQAYPEHQSY